MKKLILALFVLLVGSVAGVYFYINYKVKENVDSVIEAVKPVARITYGKIGNNMNGTIVIRNISISRADGVNANIDSIQLVLPSLRDLMNMMDMFRSNRLLSGMHLNINHLRTDISVITGMLKSVKDGKSSIADRVNTLGCGDVKILNLKNLADLGYTDADISLNIGYKYHEASNIVDMSVDIIGHDVASVSMNMEIPGITSYTGIANRENNINNVSFEFQDLGFNSRMTEYCAKKINSSPSEYLENHFKLVRKTLTEGNVILSEDIYNAYKQFLVNQAKIKMDFNPPSSVGLKYLDMYQPKDWVSVLGIDVYVNDKKLDDMSMNWNKNLTADSLFREQSESTVNNAVPGGGGTVPVSPVASSQVKIDNSDLGNYLNKLIRVETTSGRKYTGILKGESNDSISVLIKIGKGNARLPILKTQIKNVVLL